MKKLALEFPGNAGTINEGDSDIFGQSWNFAGNETTPATIINDVLPFIFVIAGLILFFMLIAGGFTIFLSAGNPEKIKKGQGMLVNALIGFLIIFASFWIIQFVEASLGLPTIFSSASP